AADDDARLTLDELERASLLQILPEILSAKRDGGLEKAGKTILVFCRSSGFIALEFWSEQDAKVLLSHLLARTRKERKKHEAPSECFWKYCV
uniref:Urotensin-2 n=1 Tax=Loxodonta africana TaxID=9785 RepID=G3SM00_LOXAF